MVSFVVSPRNISIRLCLVCFSVPFIVCFSAPLLSQLSNGSPGLLVLVYVYFSDCLTSLGPLFSLSISPVKSVEHNLGRQLNVVNLYPGHFEVELQ